MIRVQVIDAEYNVYEQSIRCHLLVSLDDMERIGSSFLTFFEMPIDFAEQLALQHGRSTVPIPFLEGMKWTLA